MVRRRLALAHRPVPDELRAQLSVDESVRSLAPLSLPDVPCDGTDFDLPEVSRRGFVGQMDRGMFASQYVPVRQLEQAQLLGSREPLAPHSLVPQESVGVVRRQAQA